MLALARLKLVPLLGLFSVLTLALVPAPAAAMPADSSGQSLSLAGGRLFTTEGQEFQFSRLALTPLACEYQPKGSGEGQTLAPDKILRIDRESGSEAALWGMGFGLSALLGSMLAVAQAESREGTTISSGAKIGVVAGLTGVSTLIGVLVGANQKRYRVVYENPRFDRP